MSNTGFTRVLALLFSLTIAHFCLSSGALWAQERPGSKASGASAKLTAEQMRGEGLYLQRCSLCHSSRNLKFGKPPSIGADLKGAFNNLPPDEEKQMRGFILTGGPHMPGFKYALSSKEVDDLVAYLKTL